MTDWIPAPIPEDESERLRRLERLGVGEGQRHEVLDQITRIACDVLGVPVALVSLVSSDRQFFLSRQGLDATSTGRPESFCGHCVVMRKPLVVEDSAADPRFASNPLVVDAPHVRAYLGVPLLAGPEQSAVGTLCAIDAQPRVWSESQRALMTSLAAVAEAWLDGIAYRRTWEDSPLSFVVLDRQGRAVRVNPALARLTGRPMSALVDQPLATSVLAADRGVLSAMLAHTLTHRESPTRREIRFMRLTGEVTAAGVSMSPLADLADQAICVIRDISLEQRTSARRGVVAEVRSELDGPLAEAMAIVQSLRATANDATAEALTQLEARLGHVGSMLDARIGDIAGRVRAEEELRVNELRVRALVEHVVGPLLVIDDRGRIVDANRAALEQLGWEYEALVGSPLRLVLHGFTESDGHRWFALASSLASEGETLPSETVSFLKRDGAELRVELRWMSMSWNGPGRLVLLMRDVTHARAREEQLLRERDDLEERVRSRTAALSAHQRAEEALKVSLREKQTLLQEIHHRVKNNLQVVSSLLTLQMDQMPDGDARAMVSESVRRVRSIALIHQHLYGSEALDRIDLGSYARELAESLRYVLAPSARVRVVAGEVQVPIDAAAPLGLLLNELLTNAFKYGAPKVREGHEDPGWDILVEIGAQGHDLTLVVRDRGRGLPTTFALGSANTLGLQLVRSLSGQLKATVTTRNDEGAVFEVRCRV